MYLSVFPAVVDDGLGTEESHIRVALHLHKGGFVDVDFFHGNALYDEELLGVKREIVDFVELVY